MDAHPVELDYDWQDQYAIGQAFRVGDVVHTSGQAAVARDGSLVGVGDFAAQAEQTMTNLATVLEAAGSGLDRVFKVNIYLNRHGALSSDPRAAQALVLAALARRHDRAGRVARAARADDRDRGAGDGPDVGRPPWCFLAALALRDRPVVR
jgi:enamine deaminase RidA (YjgF/YER057c/UK114 family)